MVKVDEYARIRQAHRQDKLTIRQLARQFHRKRPVPGRLPVCVRLMAFSITRRPTAWDDN